MTPKMFRGAVRRVLALAAVLVAAASPARAQQATTTGSVRGIVSGPGGAPVSGATVVAINSETGVRRGALADDRGRYQIPFLDPGTYTVRAQFIGYRPVEKPGLRLAIGQVEVVNFQLEQAAVTLSETRVVAEAAPLIETTKSGTSTRIDQTQIAEIPLLGRNFKDLVVLAPGTSDQGNLGSGGGQSIGGGRTGASNIMMDGVNNNEGFFGGDARGGDRAPFSYSIEAVKEIQVITAGYDVEQGNYTGGSVNAVTKSGTNKFSGALFDYVRQDKLGGLQLTANDFQGRAPVDFKSRQYGFALGGPIIKDRAHFFVALDGQRRDQPLLIFGSNATDDNSVRAYGINPDTVASVIRTAKALYGYDASGEYGQTLQKTNENALFARVDWQLNNNHKLTIRDNYTKVDLVNDRVGISPTSTEFTANGGNNTDKSNSLVGSLFSTFAAGLSNELRAQYAKVDKPRPSNPAGGFGAPLPQITISGIPSVLSNGQTITSEIRLGSDPVLHANLLRTKQTQVIDNLRWAVNNHTVKVGANYERDHVFNRFWNNSLGTFTFRSLQAFENGAPDQFSRQLGVNGQPIPVQDFDANLSAFWAQDEWQVNPNLFLTYGARYDYAWFPTHAGENTLLRRSFPNLNTNTQPIDNNNISPRFGFTFDPKANGEQVIRGGTGLFYGTSPYVLFGNALGATGNGALFLTCSAAGTVPSLDLPAYAQSPNNIPTACVGSAAAPAAPSVIVFDKNYQQPRAWKSNLAYVRLLFDTWRVTLEEAYTRIDDNYLVQDDNLADRPVFLADGHIPVFVGPSTINTGNGSVQRANSRKDNNFDQVLVHRSIGSTRSQQSIVQLQGRTGWGSMYFSYTYDRTFDNGSVPCCITGSIYGFARAAGSPNDYNDQFGPADFSRRHSFVFSPTFNLPLGIRGSAVFRTFSGLSWTPRYGFDINGDGESNDRLYVPTRADLDNMLFTGATAEDKARTKSLLEKRIEAVKCLRENRGRIVGRNGCENPWSQILDARLARKFGTMRGQNVEIQADFFNVLNGLNHKWGRRYQVDNDRTAGNDRVLIPSGFDPATNRFVYNVNTTAGKSTPNTNFPVSQFQMQLGLRYNF